MSKLTFIQSHFLKCFPHQYFYSTTIINQYSLNQKCVNNGRDGNRVVAIILYDICVEGEKLYLSVFVFSGPFEISLYRHYAHQMLFSFVSRLGLLFNGLGYHMDNTNDQLLTQ